MEFGLLLASLLWGGAQLVNNHNEQKQRELNYQKQFGLGENLELERELGVKYYKEMEQCYRDEIIKDNNVLAAFNRMLEKHFPRALDNPAYYNSSISIVATAKARLKVWEMGYKITNTVSRTCPPSDKSLLMSGWYPFFTRDSGAQPINHMYCEDINEYPWSDEYPTLNLWINRNN